MTVDIDKFAIECRLVQINGLAQALALMAHSPDFQEVHREALGGMAEAFEQQQRALWRLVFDGGEFPRASDPPKGQPRPPLP